MAAAAAEAEILSIHLLGVFHVHVVAPPPLPFAYLIQIMELFAKDVTKLSSKIGD